MDRLMVSVSGIRGTVGQTLTPQIACQFGCAFGTMLGGPGKKVVLGRDTRPSGPMVAHAITAGVLATGVDVVDVGVATTPGIALTTNRLAADGGIIITASHNPIEYNGIKFLQPTGTGLIASDAERLKAIWQAGEFSLANAECQGAESREKSVHGTHADLVASSVDANAIITKRYKVVLDSINGAGCVVTPMLLGRLGCEVAHINGEATGRFAHRPEPIEENLGDLCQAVRRHSAAVGFAQDPDADRLAIVDETGRFIGEEYTLALATAYVLRHRKGKVAANLATSRMIDDVAAAAGCEVVRAPTGEANVVQAMIENDCIFGGEGGGGVIDPRIVPVRSSLVGIAYILQYLTETGLPLSELVAQIPAYVMIKTKFPCPADATARVLPATRKAFAQHEGAQFNDADGLRIDLPEGWVCVRASNTEPIMRIMAEARDEDVAQRLVKRVREIADDVIAQP